MMKGAWILFLLFACSSYAQETIEEPKHDIVKHHSLISPYISEWWQGGIEHWDFGGSAVVTDKFIRLTPDTRSKVGWLWNDEANYLSQWEANLTFTILGKDNKGADGFALWYVEEPLKHNKTQVSHLLCRANITPCGVPAHDCIRIGTELDLRQDPAGLDCHVDVFTVRCPGEFGGCAILVLVMSLSCCLGWLLCSGAGRAVWCWFGFWGVGWAVWVLAGLFWCWLCRFGVGCAGLVLAAVLVLVVPYYLLLVVLFGCRFRCLGAGCVALVLVVLLLC